MRTYLVVWYNSDGTRTSEVVDRLMSMGFEATKGNYDFEYKWENDIELSDAISFADKVHETLADYNVHYKVETV